MTGCEISAEEMERRFDEGDPLDEYCDYSGVTVTAPQAEVRPRAVNVLLPPWLLDALDAEAARRCIPRRAVINDVLVSWADEQARRKAS